MDGKRQNDISEIEQIVNDQRRKFWEENFDTNKCNNGASFSGNGGAIIDDDSNGRTREHNSDYSQIKDAIDLTENNTKATDTEAALKNRMCAINELLDTEKTYIDELSKVVNAYMPKVLNFKTGTVPPEDLKKDNKVRLVFGNIAQIFEWHRNIFLPALERCHSTPAELGPTIKKCEMKLHMYRDYCENKHYSDHIVSEHSNYFESVSEELGGHSADLSNQLIKPVQRITKYELLLKEIIRFTKRADLTQELPGLEEAYQIMKAVCNTINDMMNVSRLQNFDGDIKKLGKLLKFGVLTCIEEKCRIDAKNSDRNACMVQKPRDLQVFLFAQAIIFAEIIGKDKQYPPPNFGYRSLIQVNNMQLEVLPNDRFILKSTDPKRREFNMICYAKTNEIYREWLETIQRILKEQNDFIKALSSPIQHQKHLTKET